MLEASAGTVDARNHLTSPASHVHRMRGLISFQRNLLGATATGSIVGIAFLELLTQPQIPPCQVLIQSRAQVFTLLPDNCNWRSIWKTAGRSPLCIMASCLAVKDAFLQCRLRKHYLGHCLNRTSDRVKRKLANSPCRWKIAKCPTLFIFRL
jgi:hypothetical protein